MRNSSLLIFAISVYQPKEGVIHLFNKFQSFQLNHSSGNKNKSQFHFLIMSDTHLSCPCKPILGLKNWTACRVGTIFVGLPSFNLSVCYFLKVHPQKTNWSSYIWRVVCQVGNEKKLCVCKRVVWL